MLSKKQIQMTLGTMARCNQEHSWIGYRFRKKKKKKNPGLASVCGEYVLTKPMTDGHKVTLKATGFCGYATIWWTKLQR